MLTAQCSLGFLVTWSVVTAPEGKKAFEFARCWDPAGIPTGDAAWVSRAWRAPFWAR